MSARVIVRRCLVDVRHEMAGMHKRTSEALVALGGGQDARTALWDVVHEAGLAATHARAALAALDSQERDARIKAAHLRALEAEVTR